MTNRDHIKTIALPEKLDLENILRFARQLDDFHGVDNLQIKFGSERWFPPFSMMFVGTKIRNFKSKNLGTHIYLRDYEKHQYPAHMGLFRMCGVDFGRDVGEARGSKRYIPITSVRREQLYTDPKDKYSEIGDLIQRHVDKIACLIIQDDSCRSEIFHALSYSLREIFRNVFEHSQANELFYAGQYWPTKSKVEVCIVDNGIGIRKSLAENPIPSYPGYSSFLIYGKKSTSLILNSTSLELDVLFAIIV